MSLDSKRWRLISCNWINNRILLGAQPEGPLDYVDLAAQGITHVIDMRVEADTLPAAAARILGSATVGANDTELAQATRAGLTRYHFPIHDGYAVSCCGFYCGSDKCLGADEDLAGHVSRAVEQVLEILVLIRKLRSTSTVLPELVGL
jgi:hypothetical protein